LLAPVVGSKVHNRWGVVGAEGVRDQEGRAVAADPKVAPLLELLADDDLGPDLLARGAPLVSSSSSVPRSA